MKKKEENAQTKQQNNNNENDYLSYDDCAIHYFLRHYFLFFN